MRRGKRCSLTFFQELKQAGWRRRRCANSDLGWRRWRGIRRPGASKISTYLSRATLVKERSESRPLRPCFGHVQRPRFHRAGVTAEIPLQWLKKLNGEKASTEEGEEQYRGAWRPRQASRNVAPAIGRAEGAHQGGKKSIRHAGLAVWSLWLQSRRLRIGQDGNRFPGRQVWDKREIQGLAARPAGPATSRLHCASAKFARTGRRRNSTSTGPSRGRRRRGLSRYFDAGGTGTTISRCFCSLTLAARWTGTSRRRRNCFRRPSQSSNT